MGLPVRDRVFPDTYGLPVYRVTKIIKERCGDEIRFLCGSELFGQIQWTHICVMKAADVIVEARESEAIAIEAFNDWQVGAAAAH